MKPIALALACTLALSAIPASAAPITVTDDQGQTLTLPAPAKRVISLAPHVTELIYAAGGAKTVWVDFPAQKSMPLPDEIRALVGG